MSLRMCIIAVAFERKLTYEEIKTCFANNPDGAGIAWCREGKNFLRKGFMDVEEFIDFYRQVDALPHVVHFRKATSGGVSPELTHPFVVDLHAPLDTTWSGRKPVVFHNGVIRGWEELFLRLIPDIVRELRRCRKGSHLPPGPWSDTRAAAVMAAYAGEEIFSFLGGKFAVLDRGRVRTYGEFVRESGVLFSKTSYKNVRRHIKEEYLYSWVPKRASGGMAPERDVLGDDSVDKWRVRWLK
ncbi:MAG: class II glutamine amidotransferase [Moorellaceae bacterium]